MDCADVRVGKGGCGLGFQNKSLLGLFILDQLMRQKFEGDTTLKFRIIGLVDNTHPASTNNICNLVFIGQHGPG